MDVVMGRSMMEGTGTDSFQMSTGKSSQTCLINHWSFVFIIVPELGLEGGQVKASPPASWSVL